MPIFVGRFLCVYSSDVSYSYIRQPFLIFYSSAVSYSYIRQPRRILYYSAVSYSYIRQPFLILIVSYSLAVSYSYIRQPFLSYVLIYVLIFVARFLFLNSSAISYSYVCVRNRAVDGVVPMYLRVARTSSLRPPPPLSYESRPVINDTAQEAKKKLANLANRF